MSEAITEFDKQLSVTQIIERTCEEICNHYCKWPEKWNPEEHDGQELMDSDICANCPLYNLN